MFRPSDTWRQLHIPVFWACLFCKTIALYNQIRRFVVPTFIIFIFSELANWSWYNGRYWGRSALFRAPPGGLCFVTEHQEHQAGDGWEKGRTKRGNCSFNSLPAPLLPHPCYLNSRSCHVTCSSLLESGMTRKCNSREKGGGTAPPLPGFLPFYFRVRAFPTISKPGTGYQEGCETSTINVAYWL